MSPIGPAAGTVTERELFLTALEYRSAAERAAFLAEACRGRPALRASVEALLDHHRDDRFLELPAMAAAPRVDTTAPAAGSGDPLRAVTEQPGDRIGRYRLLQEIGEGGGGIVFLADQDEPVRRRVALKVLKPGMDTRGVIARFEQERQALAIMDHPNIARVLDAGATPAGRPYFVMELVRGIKITEFCDANSLPPRDRLGLFIQVCHAIQHAHQKGVIHRDIKPSNILVTLHDGVPEPKVIDFGIAKAIDQRLTDKTIFTDFRLFLGTPAYTSPEQAELSGLDVDTRADIYSLGVLLYELLTGTTPFDPKQLAASGLDELRRTIREREPARPSTRLQGMPAAEATTTAQRRRSEPAHLIGLVSGDLDWIVMKCLEKDRGRRYESAAELAADIERYLHHEPILARPPSSAYRFGKFVRRHRGEFAASTAVVLALLLGTGVSIWQAFRAWHAEREQVRLRQEAEAARATEAALRYTAQAQELAARRRAYAADMNLAQQALAANNLGRARRLLDTQRPLPGQEDLRGWEWRYLWQLCRSDAQYALCQRSNEVHALSASPDGRIVAMAEASGEVSAWDLASRTQIFSAKVDPGRPLVAFSPTAPVLAFAGRDHGNPGPPGTRLRLWNVATHRLDADFQLSGPCLAMAFSADGQRLTTLTADGAALRWDLASAHSTTVTRLRLARGDARVAALSPDHRTVAFSRQGGALVLAELGTGAERWSVPAAEEELTALVFSPDGTLVGTGGGFVESAIRLWETQAGREVARLEGHRTWVSSLRFWADGATLASSSADQTIALWDVSRLAPRPADDASAGGTPILHPKAVLRGHRLEVWSLALLPDGHTLLSGAKDGTVLVWDTPRLAGLPTRLTLPGQFRAWAFEGNREALVTLGRDSTVGRWEGEELEQYRPLLTLPKNLFSPRLSPDGRFLVASLRDGTLQVWPAAGGSSPRELRDPDGPLTPVTFHPRSHFLVTQRWPGTAYQEWDLDTGERLRTWQLAERPHFPFGHSAAVSRNWFVLLGEDGSGRLLNLQTQRETALDLDLKQVTAVTVSPDDNRVAAVSRFGVGGLWDIRSGARLAGYSGVLQAMVSVNFAPNGQRLVIGSDGTEAIKLWDLDGHQELLTLPGEGSGFASCGFSARGSMLAASNREGQLHVWRAPTWAEIERAEAADPHR